MKKIGSRLFRIFLNRFGAEAFPGPVLFLLFLFFPACALPAYHLDLAETKRVLVLHSGQSDLPSNDLIAKGLRAAVTSHPKVRIEFYFEHLDSYRFGGELHRTRMLELYQQKYTDHKFDVLIANGFPALKFLSKHASGLFPNTPIVFTAVSKEHLKDLNIQPNMTGVFTIIDFKEMVQTILQIQPGTHRVVVVADTSEIGSLFETLARRRLKMFGDRLKIDYWSHLPIDALLEQASNLPEDSVVLYVLRFQEGTREPFPPWKVAALLSKAASVPVYGCFDSYMGLGIVGGRLSSFEAMGMKAGEMMLQILAGVEPENISITGEGTILNLYDWRQLRRWKIPEGRIPPGSTILFKDPSLWAAHKGRILAAIALLLIQSVIISALLRSRSRRRRMEKSLEDRLDFETLMLSLSKSFINLPAEQIDREIESGLRQIVECLDMDRITLFEYSEPEGMFKGTHRWAVDGIAPVPRHMTDTDFPWTARQVLNGRPVCFSDPAELPEEARVDQGNYRKHGNGSTIVMPLKGGGPVIGAISADSVSKPVPWSDQQVQRWILLGEIFSNALLRKYSEEALRQYELTVSTAKNPIALVDGNYMYTLVNDAYGSAFERSKDSIIGNTVADLFGEDLFNESLKAYYDRCFSGEVVHYQIWYGFPGWGRRFVDVHYYPIQHGDGAVQGAVVNVVDLTDVKQTEERLLQSEALNRGILMSLTDHIAVLDRDGTIVTVNESWLNFGRANGTDSLENIGPGINYMDICRNGLTESDDTSRKALSGIDSVLQGRTQKFRLEYPCHSPRQQRWFLMSVMPLKMSRGGVIVAHTDISERKLVEQQLTKAFIEIDRLKNRLEADAISLQDEIHLEYNFENIIGSSNPLKYVLHRVQQVASTDATVLIQGETGTGKELIARAVHAASPRSGRPLIKVNCAALPASLIESELFGHEKGSFSGAVQKKLGRFEIAHGTSIFLDEIGELPLELQSRLLRVLQDGEMERVGGNTTIQVDARVIAATNRDLKAEVESGRFREDLWFRLNVFPITVPPLRHRKEDIPLLTEHFVKLFSKRIGKNYHSIPRSVLEALQGYPWPGNVRELQNVLERAVISSREPVLKLAEKLKTDEESQVANSRKTLDQLERDYIVEILEQTAWKVEGDNGAAAILDLHPSTLRGRMRKHKVRKP